MELFYFAASYYKHSFIYLNDHLTSLGMLKHAKQHQKNRKNVNNVNVVCLKFM